MTDSSWISRAPLSIWILCSIGPDDVKSGAAVRSVDLADWCMTDSGRELRGTVSPGARRARAEIHDEILATTARWRAVDGAPACRSRAVARDVGMVSSTVCQLLRQSRQLLAALIVAADATSVN